MANPKIPTQDLIKSFNFDLTLELDKIGPKAQGLADAVAEHSGNLFDSSDIEEGLQSVPLQHRQGERVARGKQFAQALEKLIEKNDNEKYFLVQDRHGNRVVKARRNADDEVGVPLLAINAQGHVKDLSIKKSTFKASALNAAIDGRSKTHEWDVEAGIHEVARRSRDLNPLQTAQDQSDRKIKKYEQHPQLRQQWDDYRSLNLSLALAKTNEEGLKSKLTEKPGFLKRRKLEKELAVATQNREKAETKIANFRSEHNDFNEFQSSLARKHWGANFENALSVLKESEKNRLSELAKDYEAPPVDKKLNYSDPKSKSKKGKNTTIATMKHRKAGGIGA